MISKTIEVKNRIGFHARPVALLIETAKKYNCKLEVSKGDHIADMRSIVNLLRMQVKMGDNVSIIADGEKEEEALEAVISLIDSKFGED